MSHTSSTCRRIYGVSVHHMGRYVELDSVHLSGDRILTSPGEGGR